MMPVDATLNPEPALVHKLKIENNPEVRSDDPLNGVTEKYARRFHKKYQLPVEQAVFVRGVLALRSQIDIKAEFETIQESHNTNGLTNPTIELSVGEHRYTRLESGILYKAFMPHSRRETLRNLSRMHRLLIVACICAAMTQGWDQAAMAGAAIEVMGALGKCDSDTTHPCAGTYKDKDGKTVIHQSTWLLGTTVGVPFFAGAILGLVITDPITRILRFGRRGAICVAGIFSFISVIGSASVHKWEHLLVFRILLGAGMAGKASIVPILLSETSPKDVRGFLLVFWQLFVAFGLAAGSVANLSVYRLDMHSSWRYMFISAFIPALLLLSLILFSPESPRWLLKESGAIKGLKINDPRRGVLIREAFKSLIELRGESVPILAAGELFLMHTRLIDEQRRLNKALRQPYPPNSATHGTSEPVSPFKDVIDHISWRQRVTLMFFRSGYTRRAHRAAAAVMISQQLCGINLIVFLADNFLSHSLFSSNETLTKDQNTKALTEDRGTNALTEDQNTKLLAASLGLMFLGFIAVIPAMFVIDIPDGRRRALNWSFPVMGLSLLGSALVLGKSETPSGHPSVAKTVWHYIFLALFMIAYSIGEGPAAFVVSAEVFPLVNRELGMSVAVCWNFVGAGLLAVISPWLLAELDQFGTLLLFAGTNTLAWFLCFWLVPSTGKEDLEEIFEQLDISSWFMLTYRLETVLYILATPVAFCLRLDAKTWKYPKRLQSARVEWQGRRREPTNLPREQPSSSDSSEYEMEDYPGVYHQSGSTPHS